MKNSPEVLDRLRIENPFVSSSVGDPMKNRYPDVASINETAFKGLVQLIEQKIRTPDLPCAGMVFGETGSGKTHLISRTLTYRQSKKNPFSFAYMQPIEDADQTYRYLLREVIISLCYPMIGGGQATQMDMIVEKILADVPSRPDPPLVETIKVEPSKKDRLMMDFKDGLRQLAQRRKKPRPLLRDISRLVKTAVAFLATEDNAQNNIPEPARRDLIDFVHDRFPDIPRIFLKVLFQYPVRAKRSAAIEWLKGMTIDPSDAALLGLPEPAEQTPAMMEQQAKNMLGYLGMLLTHYGQPLVICFDRLENYDTDEKVRSLGKMVEYLVDSAKAILPIVFVRGAQWEEKFRNRLNQQIITRLETNEFTLKGCNDGQALEIIDGRLKTVLGNHAAGDLFPFDRSELTHTFKTRLHSPRQVIMIANQRLRGILYPEKGAPSAVTALEQLRKDFDRSYRSIEADFDRYPPDRSRLRRALELYLSERPDSSGFRVESLHSPSDKFIDLRGTIRCGDVAVFEAVFIIDVERNSPSVRASLKRGIEFLESAPSGQAFYIRDRRCEIPPPPQWASTNDMLRHFQDLGGNTLFLDNMQAARWYALALLNYAVKEGEVTITDSEYRSRAVTVEELSLFIKTSVHEQTFSGFWHIGEKLRKQ